LNINVNPKANLKIEPLYLFIIITSIQTGVGTIGLPRLVFAEARQDGWISILIAFVCILVVLTVMLQLLKQYNSADIFGIQVDIFGNWLGKFLGTIYIIYFAVALFSILITYIELVKIFVFPNVSGFLIGLLLLLLTVYSVLGGLRVMVGVCFVFFLFSHWILILLIQPITMMDMSHFLPILEASPAELLAGARTTSYTFLGIEILLLVYPFIMNKQKAKKPVYLTAVWSTLLTLTGTVISIGYFSHEQLLRREWATLSLYKFQGFAFVERFDYIVVAVWMTAILPNLILFMWAITYGLKRLYKIPQKLTLYLAAIIFLIGCSFINKHFQIQAVIDTVANVGFWIVYVYPFILLAIVLIKKRWRSKKGDTNNANH